MTTRPDRNQVIPDRRIAAALDKLDGGAQLQAVRELIEEAFKRGMNAGQMKERLRAHSRYHGGGVDECSSNPASPCARTRVTPPEVGRA